jgi:hypothetical protein
MQSFWDIGENGAFKSYPNLLKMELNNTKKVEIFLQSHLYLESLLTYISVSFPPIRHGIWLKKKVVIRTLITF